jgi:hypothetical protein
MRVSSQSRSTSSTGLWVLRVWLEEGTFRARITSTVDVANGSERNWVGRTPEDVARALEQFIAEFIDGAETSE